MTAPASEVLRLLAQRRYDGALVLVSGEDPRILETATRLARSHPLNVVAPLPKPCQPAALATLLERWKHPVAEEIEDALGIETS